MSIPVQVPGSPWSDAADNSSLTVNTLVRVPASIDSYGGTADQPVYFYNRSLGTSGIVCGTSNWTAGRSCCPRSIGILDTASPTNCRFRNSTRNEEYWRECTAAVGGGSYPIQSRCWSAQEFLGYMENQTAVDLRAMGGAAPIACGAIGPTAQWNYTATCCEQIRGDSMQWRAVPGTEDRWSAIDCFMADVSQQSAFNICISQHTWVVCNNTDITGGEGGNGGVNTGGSPDDTSVTASTSGPTPSSTFPSGACSVKPVVALLLALAGLVAVL